MSKTKRKAAAPPAPSRDAAVSTESDLFAGLLRMLVSGLVVVRWLIPAESAASGDTLWVVQLDLAIVILWAWAGLRNGRFAVRWSLFDSALWALVAAHGLSAAAVFVTGGDRRAALNMAWEWVGLGITFFLVRQTIQNALDARRLAAILVAIAVVLGGLGIWQHYVFYRLATREYKEIVNEIDSLEKNPGANSRRLGELQFKLESQGIPTDEMGRKQYINRLQFSNEALGPFALANTFAGYLLVMLLMAGELFRTLAGPRAKSTIAAWSAAFLVLVYCLILTKSRTAWVGLFIAGLSGASRSWSAIGSGSAGGLCWGWDWASSASACYLESPRSGKASMPRSFPKRRSRWPTAFIIGTARPAPSPRHLAR